MTPFFAEPCAAEQTPRTRGWSHGAAGRGACRQPEVRAEWRTARGVHPPPPNAKGNDQSTGAEHCPFRPPDGCAKCSFEDIYLSFTAAGIALQPRFCPLYWSHSMLGPVTRADRLWRSTLLRQNPLLRWHRKTRYGRRNPSRGGTSLGVFRAPFSSGVRRARNSGRNPSLRGGTSLGVLTTFVYPYPIRLFHDFAALAMS